MPSSAGSWLSTGNKTDDGIFQTNTPQALAEVQAPDVFLAFGDDTQPVKINLLCIMDVKIFRALILGELERGQNQYQALCFITRLSHNEIISSESMARLRQKNPHTVRTAEEKKPTETLSMNVAVNVMLAWQLSTLVYNTCSVAHDAVYTREADMHHWLDTGIESSVFETLPQAVEVPGLKSCRSVTDLWQACSCSYSMRLEWYPCLLKYCRNKDSSGHSAPYKCGIKSCSKGYDFTYYTPHKQLCLWEEET
ncbi:out at first protein homolog [Tachysurus ichikawai]